MLRKEQSVKGIHINNKLFLLSQYADDTNMYLDGSESSLRSTLNFLHKFYEMSGLKINKEMSGLKLCQEFRPDWDQGSIKIIGVIFTPETFYIWDRNSELLLNKVENLLSIWSKRKLTLLGKVTVIKSLALSKFIHLFLALPNPPGQLAKQLEKKFYKFIWNYGPD